MIYCNKEFSVEEKEMSFGKMNVIILGQEGRGRKPIYLPSNIDLKKGENKATISFSRSKKPKVNMSSNNGKFIIIDSYGGYSRRGSGYIKHNDDVKEISTGNGADGDAGRIGDWEVTIFEVINSYPFWMFIKYSGGTRGKWLYVTESEIIEVVSNQIELFCDQKDIDVPGNDYFKETETW